VVTRAMVEDPAGQLHELLQNPDDPGREALFRRLLAEEERTLENSLRKKEAEFRERYGIAFSDRRIKLITQRAVEERGDVDSVVEGMLAVHREVQDFARKFSSRSDVHIEFTEEAVDQLVVKIWDEGVEPGEFLKRSFQNYEHGLKLINEKTGKRDFSIPAEGIENPENYLNLLIRETYKGE
jgi:ATP-dependent Clp protease ATP-binding subunit ClpX